MSRSCEEGMEEAREYVGEGEREVVRSEIREVLTGESRKHVTDRVGGSKFEINVRKEKYSPK